MPAFMSLPCRDRRKAHCRPRFLWLPAATCTRFRLERRARTEIRIAQQKYFCYVSASFFAGSADVAVGSGGVKRCGKHDVCYPGSSLRDGPVQFPFLARNRPWANGESREMIDQGSPWRRQAIQLGHRPPVAISISWLGMLAISGCAAMWPFGDRERTSFHTPALRVDTIRQLAAQADGTNSAEQQRLVGDLARQIQIENDPLVREAIIASAAEFQTPLAERILLAGLNDDAVAVRILCCRLLGKRAEPQLIEPLSGVIRQDSDIDVRMAAISALGEIKAAEAVQALSVALDHRDPAVQYAGVQALKSASGEDFGNDVRAWRQFVAGETPTPPREISVAERLRQLSPL